MLPLSQRSRAEELLALEDLDRVLKAAIEAAMIQRRVVKEEATRLRLAFTEEDRRRYEAMVDGQERGGDCHSLGR